MTQQTGISTESALNTNDLILDDVITWLRPKSLGQLSELMATASRIKELHGPKEVEFCAIVNAKSGRCSENCAFCAQSAHHPDAPAEVYSLLSAEEIAFRARAAADAGACRFGIVTSGRGCPRGKDFDSLLKAVELINKEGRIAPCLSLGLLSPDQARSLKQAGAVRYHHNLEAGPGFFGKICTSHTFQDRVDTVINAQQAGLEVCVGGILGLGESLSDRAEMAQVIAELKPESVPLNFLNPISGTPLAGLSPMPAMEALAAISVYRLFLPEAHIRACGGREQVLGPLAPLMYLAGASAAMTGDYLTTTGSRPQRDLADLAALGLTRAEFTDLGA